MNARRVLEFMMPDALAVHTDWLRDLVQGDAGLLAKLQRSLTVRRLLARKLYERHGLQVPARAALEPNQKWLLAGHAKQTELARSLGIEALHELIRTAIDGPTVAALRSELGDTAYRRAIAGPGLAVMGVEPNDFRAALRRGRVGEYFVSVGAALLETTTCAGDPFCAMRMRFAFSPACWRQRPRGIRPDDARLAARIAELMET
jgi:hypothetical protein